MKIIIIGAVAAGTSAAAKARRNSEDAVIRIYEMDTDISYSGCGLPYYIADDSIKREELVPRDTKFFKEKYNVDIFTFHKVDEIIPEKKEIKVTDLASGKAFTDSYDKLVIATGAQSIIPPVKGLDETNCFTLRNVRDADKIKKYIKHNNPSKAFIIGSGFIGLEMTEAFSRRGIDVSVAEIKNNIMPSLDADMSRHLEEYLDSKGIKMHTGTGIKSVEGNFGNIKITLQNNKVVHADFILSAAGIKPNVSLAEKAGVKLGLTGAISVNESMETSIRDIFACGDCAESFFLIDKKPLYRPLGSTANKTGRITGESVFKKPLKFKGVLGTGIFRVFDIACAQTGMTQEQAEKNGIETVVCHNIKPAKPKYMGGKNIIIKAVAERKTGLILGVQIIGEEGVDKRIDVFVTAMSYGGKVSDLFHLDLAYAPPYSTTKDPVMYTGMILENYIYNNRKLLTAEKLMEILSYDKDIQIIDSRIKKQFDEGHVEMSRNIPHSILRDNIKSLDPDKPVITYCNKGVTGNAAQNILINSGFKKVYNLSGGHEEYKRLICMLKKRSTETYK